MIKMINAYTYEVDDVETAVGEIMQQLDLQNNLKANSFGIINCFSDFITTGVVKTLCDALPFPVVGTTSNSFSTNEAIDNIMLSLSVITSDDLHFSCQESESLWDVQKDNIISAYESAASKLKNKPSLILVYAPLIHHVGGDIIVKTLDEISGGIATFGTLTVDHTMDYHEAQVIFNGEVSTDKMSLVLIEGDIDPEFLQFSIPENKIQKQKAIITKSEGTILKEVNNIPIMKYLELHGLIDSISKAANVIPFIIDLNDGTPPIARSIYHIDDNGYAVCGGEMPEGATLALGFIDFHDIVSSAEEATKQMLQSEKYNGAIIFSCLARHLTLEVDEYAEMEKIQEILGNHIPYTFCYSGGEICPVTNTAKNLTNRFHNDTLIICMF